MEGALAMGGGGEGGGGGGAGWVVVAFAEWEDGLVPFEGFETGEDALGKEFKSSSFLLWAGLRPAAVGGPAREDATDSSLEESESAVFTFSAHPSLLSAFSFLRSSFERFFFFFGCSESAVVVEVEGLSPFAS